MKKYTTLLVLLIIVIITLRGQPEGELVGDRIVAFYPDDFVALETLPSFALLAEPDSIGPVPQDWEIFPEFYSQAGFSNARIEYPDGVDLYGTGEVVGPLRRNGTEVIMWNTDNYGYWTADGKRLYQSHPWIMGLREDGSCFGILVDHTWKQAFYLDNPIEIHSEGPPFRILVIDRDTPQEMITTLGELTGTIAMPPLWALGYQQCRYSYYPDDRVMEIATEFRERNLPCDVIWMDIDYMDGYRVFTFDPSGFPDPEGLNDFLHQLGFKSIWMIDPGVKYENGYFVYDSGTENDIWVQQSGGETYVGDVWPGPCTFPDFTMPEAHTWWAGLYQDFMATGIDGIWNDMNEPAVFNGPDKTMPVDNIHRGGGGLPEDIHLRYHNVYGYLMVEASREGIMQANPEKRPFVLTRANHLGGQRFAATWTGDNNSSWEHMKLSIPMSLTLGLSGQPFSGPDIGGFNGGPSPELMAHWMALGAFYPFSRNHTSTGTPDQEPWAFGPEVEEASRIALNRRYRLLPYFYTLFHEAATTGMPVMRPVFFADPANPLLRTEEEAFLLGSDLLIVPKWAENPALPDGIWRTVSIAGESSPGDAYQPEVKLQAGSIIPLAQPMQSTAYFQHDSVTLLISPDAEKHAFGKLYADAGEGWEYLEGEYAITTFEAIPLAADTLLVSCNNLEGNFNLSNRRYRVGVVTSYETFYGDWTADTLIKTWLPPDIALELTSPEDGTQFPENTQIPIIAEIDDSQLVQYVAFYRDNVLIGEVDEAPYEIYWEPDRGIYEVQAEAVFQDTISILSNTARIVVGEFGSGSILSQVWYDVPGIFVEDLTSDPRYPEDPDENNYPEVFSSPVNTADNYGRRMIGYVHPPESGYYTFWIAGDDYCELWLSSDTTFANRELIAEVPGWTLPGEWEKYPEQKSVTVSLTAESKYFIMTLQKELDGEDFVSVAWEPPGGSREVIDGLFLSPFDAGAAAIGTLSGPARLRLYPNPADQFVEIKTDVRQGMVSVYTINGSLVASKEIVTDGSGIHLETGKFKPGIYFVKLRSVKGSTVEKLIVR